MALTGAAFFAVTGVAGFATVALMRLGADEGKTVLLLGCVGSIVTGGLILAFGRHINPMGHLALLFGAIVNLTFLLAISPDTSIAVAAVCIYPCYGCHAAFVFSWRLATAVAAFAVPCCILGVLSRDDLQWPTAIMPATVLVVVGVTVAILSRLASEAEIDSLTGLLNRRGFDRAVDTALAETSPGSLLAVVLIDVDRFGSINDRFGYRVGNLVLQQISAELRRRAPSGAVLAHYGGDEFAVLLTGAGEAQAIEAAERIRTAMNVDCSAGVTSWRSGDTASLFIGRAEIALYRAKSAGRSRTALESAQRPAIVAELRAAIESESIAMHYQPIVDLSCDDRIVGVEALLRWSSKMRPDLSAAEIIGVAEDNDLIDRLGAAVLRRVCGDAPMIQRGLGATRLIVNVNVSVLELADLGYVDRVLEILTETEWPPEQLVLELTESCLAAESAPLHAIFDQLRQKGVRIAIDDFGSGYSSLNRLAALPFDALKVDRSVIANTETARRILTTIVALAAAFELGVVVEGVETDEQAELVRSVGIDRAQGYLFGQAVSIDDLHATPAAIRDG